MYSTLVKDKKTPRVSSGERPFTVYRRAKLQDQSDRQRRLLQELANLRDDGVERFWRYFFGQKGHGMEQTLDQWRKQAPGNELLHLRDQLREVWKGDYHWLQEWLSHINLLKPALVPLPVRLAGSVKPVNRMLLMRNPLNLRVQLLFGVVDNSYKMAVCQNPDCQSPYFFRYKDSRQRFCGEEECLAYGQRDHKRAWWRKQQKSKL